MFHSIGLVDEFDDEDRAEIGGRDRFLYAGS